jgi:hypothetical protein
VGVKIINSFWSALLGPTIEGSLENQQCFWKILEYKVLDEETCTWAAKARRVSSLDGEEGDARVQVLDSTLMYGRMGVGRGGVKAVCSSLGVAIASQSCEDP